MKEPARLASDAEEEGEALRRIRECFGSKEKLDQISKDNLRDCKSDWKGVERH